MLLFGHAGITLGLVWVSQGAILRLGAWREGQTEAWKSAGGPRESISPSPGIRCLASTIDYGLILLGSILPDIIDKPVGQFLLRDIFSNDRIFGHTLLFSIIIAVAGVFIYRGRRNTSLLCISFGSLSHLSLDQMWLTPGTLFWPLYGWQFAREDLSDWIGELLACLVTDCGLYVPELIGVSILALFFWQLIRQRNLRGFLATGAAI